MRRDVPRRAFRGPDLASVSASARAALGEDALVLATRTLRPGLVELVAADAADVARFERRLTPAAPPAERSAAGGGRRPLVVALVGPTGAGKTTTAVKLAVNRDAFGARRVGVVTLDTYRAGAVAQLETYAAVARIPLEVVYDVRDVLGALARLSDRDVVIVDTPGRGPKSAAEDAEWRALLGALAPDEVHLVLPATVRPDIAERLRDAMDAMDATDPTDAVDAAPGDAGAAAAAAPAAGAPTHLLMTKLDEVPDESGVAELAALVDLPVRWVTDGQEIPTALAAGVPRLVRALGSPGLDRGAGDDATLVLRSPRAAARPVPGRR